MTFVSTVVGVGAVGHARSAWSKGLVGAGKLLVRSRYADRQLAGRVHESAMQYHRGVPVYGGGITRQLAGGATVSIFGTIHQGIDIDTTPALSATAARTALQNLSGGAALVSGPLPALTVFPLPDRSYALTWRSPNGELPDGSPIVTVDIVAHEIDSRRHPFLGNRYADRGPVTPVQGRPTAMATLSLVRVPYPAIGRTDGGTVWSIRLSRDEGVLVIGVL